jgi:hypothetical protein
MIDPDWPLVALAAEDVLPVVLSVAGFVVLSRLATSLGRTAGSFVWAGTALIGLGGLSKPIYKSALALTSGGLDWLVLDDLLFWLLAPGFVLAGAGLRAAARSDRGAPSPPSIWALITALGIVALGAGLALLLPDTRAWFLTLLTAATIGNLWVIVVLVGWSRFRGERLAAVLFTVNIVVVFALAGSAAALPQTIPVQWGEQLAATAAQGAFLWAAVRLRGRDRVDAARAAQLPI